MKSILATSLFLLFCFSFNSAYSQLSSLGLDRSIGGSSQFKESKNKPKESFDFVQASTDSMTKELQLDGFQSAAVKSIIEDYKNAVISINEESIPDEGKSEKMEKAKEKMESKMLSLLNKNQVVLFQALKEKKDKKGKKKDKKSQD